MGSLTNQRERQERAALALAALEDFLDGAPVLPRPSEEVLAEGASVLRLYVTDGA